MQIIQLVIHLLSAMLNNRIQSMNQLHRAFRVHVVQTQFVVNRMEQARVNVYRSISATHMKDVDQNVF